MQKVVLGRDMKSIDTYTIHEIGIESLVLMERAAYQTYLNIQKFYPDLKKDKPIVAFCGCGNNGADGVALARMLLTAGYHTILYICGNKAHASPEFLKQISVYQNLEGEFIEDMNIPLDAQLLIDALFGVGLNRPVMGNYADAIAKINASKMPVVAVDIPSGIDSTTGEVLGSAVKAECTVTFGTYKSGLLLYPGASYAGQILVENIGFAPKAFSRLSYDMFTYDACDIVNLPARNPLSNKGTYGKISVIAGSDEMCGAAYLSGMAAYRSGAGIVRIYTSNKNVKQLQILLPEAILTGYDTEHLSDTVTKEVIDYADVIVIGPGLGKSETAKQILHQVLTAGKLTVVDADAINLLAIYPEEQNYLHENVILTPHLGEMSRLSGRTIPDLKKDLIANARSMAEKLGCVIVQKDARTIVTDGYHTYLNRFGNSGMATGGSGDVLSGITGAMAAAMKKPFEAATMAVFLHSLAGDQAASEVSEYAMMAGDLLTQIDKLTEGKEEQINHENT